MNSRTRIKICGMTRPEDVRTAVMSGADALGFVFYEKSPRHVSFHQAASLIADVPPFVTCVGLFVNQNPDQVCKARETAPITMLQFHGDETIEQCAAIAEAVRLPFMKAVRMAPDVNGDDLIKLDRDCCTAGKWFAGLLLDAFADGYGGSGKVFDWSLIPKEIAPRVVLSGGLNVHNVADAIRRVHPCAVDVSSGVEQAKGIKDSTKITAFIGEVIKADAATNR